MNTKQRIGTVTFVLLLTYFSLFGQQYNTFKIDGLYSKNYVHTPEVSAIRRVSLSSVNYSTGSADIRIPLLDVVCGDLKLPIYLSYNSSGIKVNEPCSWVGQNWTLHAEPIISRTVRGHVDNGSCNFDFYQDRTSYFWMRKYLDNNIRSTVDNMPDEYNFSLLSGGGMFMYCQTQDKKGKYVCLPYDDIKVISDHELVDPYGTRYVFYGGEDQAISPTNYSTAWHASSVEAANGVDRITFSYNTAPDLIIKRHEDHIVVVDNLVKQDYMGYGGGYTDYGMIDPEAFNYYEEEELFRMPVIYKTFDDKIDSYQLSDEHQLVTDGRATQKVEYYPDITYRYQRLSEISYAGNKVTFFADNNKPYNLTDIIVTNSSQQIIKHLVLNYEEHKNRYYLTDIKEVSSDSIVVSSYHFNYSRTGDVAPPGARAYDFWGYNNAFNTQYSNISMVPLMKLYVNRMIPYGHYVQSERDSLYLGGDFCGFNKRIRRADEYYMQAGMLSSIEYPTGAKEFFEWEANRAPIYKGVNSDENGVFNIEDELDRDTKNNEIFILGGLRIKNIGVVENGDTTMKRSFVYGQNGAGISPLQSNINYFLRKQTKIYNDLTIRNNLGHNFSEYRTLSSTPIVPITHYNGASVMYDQVQEYTCSKGDTISKTVYKYNLPECSPYRYLTPEDTWDFHLQNYNKWFTDYLKSKEIYEKTDCGYKIVSSDSYEYMYKNMVNDIIVGREYRNDYIENFSEQDLNYLKDLVSSKYVTYSAMPKAKLLTSETHTDYLSNGVKMVKTKSYGYDNPTDIRMTSQIVSQGDEKYSIYTTYPSTIGTGVYAAMVEKNMLDYPIEERIVRNNYIIAATLATYQSQDNTFYPNKIYKYSPGSVGCNISNFSTFNGLNINTLYTPLVSLNYINGRLVKITDRQNIQTIYKWDTTLKYPLSEKKQGGNNEQICTFTYMDGVGTTSITKPNSDVISYQYDTAGRLSMIKNRDGNTLQKYEYKYVTGSALSSQMTSSVENGISDNKPTSITLSQKLVKLPLQSTFILSVNFIPSSAVTDVMWSSSNERVARVSTTGEVTVVGNGSCLITATTTNGLKSTCRVIVVNTDGKVI